MTDSKRMPEFDIMRSLGIFIILFHHLTAYTFNYYDLRFFGIEYDLTYVNDLNRYFALGIFVYISGCLMSHGNRAINNLNDVYIFLSKRIVRLIPLYLFALTLFLALHIAEPISLPGLITHVMGLQVLLATTHSEPIATLWYIGLIISYYLVFVVIRKYGIDQKKQILIIAIIPLVAIALKIGLGIIDKRFFVYYAVFITGLYSSKIHDKMITNKTLVLLGLIFFASIYLYVSKIYPAIYATEITPPLFSFVSMSALLLLNSIMISFVCIIHYLAKIIKVQLRVFFFISYSSYCIYLFHRPIWGVMLKILEPENVTVRLAYLTLVGIPVMIVMSYAIQRLYDNMLASKK